MRRKGEQKVKKHRPPYDEKHPVAHRIRTGDNWFYAWMADTLAIWDPAPIVIASHSANFMLMGVG